MPQKNGSATIPLFIPKVAQKIKKKKLIEEAMTLSFFTTQLLIIGNTANARGRFLENSSLERAAVFSIQNGAIGSLEISDIFAFGSTIKTITHTLWGRLGFVCQSVEKQYPFSNIPLALHGVHRRDLLNITHEYGVVASYAGRPPGICTVQCRVISLQQHLVYEPRCSSEFRFN